MSGATVRVPLEDAEYIAGELRAEITDYCDAVYVAGSIRRRRPTCGDIDLVCVPTMATQVDMFGGAGTPRDLLHERLETLLEHGVIDRRLDKSGRPAWGKSLKRAIYGGMAVDIQAVSDPDTWGMWFLVRTGPASWNKRIVTPKRQGGLLPAGFEIKDGFQVWSWGERVPTPTERSAFAALGIDYVEPWDR